MRRALLASLAVGVLCGIVAFTSDLSLSLSGHHSVCGVPVSAGIAHAVLCLIFLGVPTATVSAVVFSTGLLARHGQRLAESRRHLCPACGYDLRATPDQRPECGRPRSDA